MAGSCCGVGPSTGGVPLARTPTQPVTGTSATTPLDAMMAQLAALGINGGLNGASAPSGVNSQGLNIFG